jgi:hypothetical protein
MGSVRGLARSAGDSVRALDSPSAADGQLFPTAAGGQDGCQSERDLTLRARPGAGDEQRAPDRNLRCAGPRHADGFCPHSEEHSCRWPPILPVGYEHPPVPPRKIGRPVIDKPKRHRLGTEIMVRLGRELRNRPADDPEDVNQKIVRIAAEVTAERTPNHTSRCPARVMYLTDWTSEQPTLEVSHAANCDVPNRPEK